MGMLQAGNRSGLIAECLSVIFGQLGMEYLDRCLRSQMNVLSKVDFGEASFPQEVDEEIVAKLLAYTVGHPQSSHLSNAPRRSFN
jgi:hypothetical protein